MRRIFRAMVLATLTTLARLALSIHKPIIVAVTGSVGKTTTKDMITVILREAGFSVRGSRKSYNGDFGVPLSIFGLRSGVRNVFEWFYILAAAYCKTIFGLPRYIVLEVGLEDPGDIYRMVRWLHPDISILTALSENPVHLENFPSREDLYREKMSLLCATKRNGVVVYNYVDGIQESYMKEVPRDIQKRSFNSKSVSVVTAGIHYDEKNNPIGTDVVLTVRGNEETFYIPGTLGTGVVQALTAAVTAACALESDISISTMRRAIAGRVPTPGRMRILPGIAGSVIIDDSYNASPVAVESALRVLSIINKKRKIAVFGAMAQLGEESSALHSAWGKRVMEVAEKVIVVGEAQYGEGSNIQYVANTKEAIRECLPLVGADTVFLCKGSQIARIERVVKGLLDPSVDPERELVRQEPYWLESDAEQ